MGIEIERKFTVIVDALPPLEEGERIVQGYMATTSKGVVRARIKGEKAFLTLKGKNSGARRLEFEYPIPVPDAEEIIETLCDNHVIEKVRYLIIYQNHTFEVDIFEGDNHGLVVAEVELESEDEIVALPPWIEKEVTGDVRYYNSQLNTMPFTRW